MSKKKSYSLIKNHEIVRVVLAKNAEAAMEEYGEEYGAERAVFAPDIAWGKVKL